MGSRARMLALARIQAITDAITRRSIPRMLDPLLATDLSLPQLKALTVVVTSAGGMSGVELARSFGVTLAATSKLLDRLAAQDLIERTPDPHDQRVRRVVPTALGRAVVAQLMAARPELGEDVLAGLDDSELQALEVGLAAVSRELRRHTGDVDL